MKQEIIQIKWASHCTNSNWLNEADQVKIKILDNISIGFLVCEDKDSITLKQTTCFNGNAQNFITIPKCSIKTQYKFVEIPSDIDATMIGRWAERGEAQDDN